MSHEAQPQPSEADSSVAEKLTGSRELAEFLESVPLGPDGKLIGGLPTTASELLKSILYHDLDWARRVILQGIHTGIFPDLRATHIVRGTQEQETYLHTAQYSAYFNTIQSLIDGEYPEKSAFDSYCVRTVFEDIAERRRSYGLTTTMPDPAIIHLVQQENSVDNHTQRGGVHSSMDKRIEVRTLTPIEQIAVLYHESVHLMTKTQTIIAYNTRNEAFIAQKQTGFVTETKEDLAHRLNMFSSGAHPIVEAVTEEAARRFMRRMALRDSGNLGDALRSLNEWRTTCASTDSDLDLDEVLDFFTRPDGTISTIRYGYSSERQALQALINDLVRAEDGVVDTTRADKLFNILEAGLYTGEVPEFIRLFNERHGQGAWKNFLECCNGTEQAMWLSRRGIIVKEK